MSDSLAFAGNSTPSDRKIRMLNSHLDALRHSHSRLPAHPMFGGGVVEMQGGIGRGGEVVSKGLHLVVQEGMDVVFSQLSQQEGAAALLQRCDKPIQLLYSYLHPASQSLSAQQTKQYIPFGRMRVRQYLTEDHRPALEAIAQGLRSLKPDSPP
ncbi:hypothetical protein ABBQ38_012046 [Trebouxia sp. C0009 RCD-2024]